MRGDCGARWASLGNRSRRRSLFGSRSRSWASHLPVWVALDEELGADVGDEQLLHAVLAARRQALPLFDEALFEQRAMSCAGKTRQISSEATAARLGLTGQHGQLGAVCHRLAAERDIGWQFQSRRRAY